MKQHLFCMVFLLLAACVFLPHALQSGVSPASPFSAAGFFFPSDAVPASAAGQNEKSARVVSPDAGQTHEQLLFPGLNADAVTAISVTADGRSFDFLCSGAHEVSVNGSRADSESFRTLIAQIAEITVTPAAPYPEGGQPFLHLAVSAGGTQYQASFFADGKSPLALVRSGSRGDWHRTEGWRVGTLMLTCEGARMEDML